jgi:hypothetical protein
VYFRFASLPFSRFLHSNGKGIQNKNKIEAVDSHIRVSGKVLLLYVQSLDWSEEYGRSVDMSLAGKRSGLH